MSDAPAIDPPRDRLALPLFLALAALAAVVMFAASTLLLWQQVGLRPPVKGVAYWVPDTLAYKRELAERPGENRLLILAGSNALFGIDAGELSRLLDRPVVNLATHARLPLDYLLHVYADILRPGDTVLAPLELHYYGDYPVTQSWFAANAMAWDPGYVRRLPWSDRSAMLRKLPVRHLLLRLVAGEVLPPVPLRQREPPAPGDTTPVQREPNVSVLRGLDPWGSLVFALPPRPEAPRWFYIGAVPERADREVAAHLDAWRAFARDRGIAFELTWPVMGLTGRNTFFAAGGKRARLIRLNESLAGDGFPVLCSPFDSHLPMPLLFDSPSHPNARGTSLRTERLAACLKTGVTWQPGAPAVDAAAFHAWRASYLEALVDRAVEPVLPIEEAIARFPRPDEEALAKVLAEIRSAGPVHVPPPRPVPEVDFCTQVGWLWPEALHLWCPAPSG